MNAPLSLFLTRFPTSPPETLAAMPTVSEPMIVMSQAELNAKLEAAVEAVRLELSARHAADLATHDAARQEAIVQALAAARTDWVQAEGEALGARFAAGLDQLRVVLGGSIEAVLRPFLAEAIVARAAKELRDVMARLQADAGERMIQVTGPDDMIAVLRTACPAQNIAWIADQTVDVVIVADATRIETRLGAALRALEPTES